MKKYLYLLIAACMLFLGAVQAQYLKTDATKNFFQLRDAIKKEVEEKKSHEEFESGEHEHDDLLSKFYRWEHFMLPRVSPQGNLFTPDAVYNAYRNYFSINTKSPLAKSNAWQAVGPFTDITDAANFAIVGVGRMNCVTQHPLDSNTLFVGTMGGGIWKTTNNGASWICLDENLPSMSISDIAINPIHPDTMYIATGDAVGNYNVPSIPDFHQGHYSCGVMMSTDGGASWLPTGFTYTQMQAENIYRLVVDPIEPSHLLIGCDKGMYRSIDAGMTWAQLDTLKVVDIQINPLDANKYYAITKNGSRLSRSYDGGASFSITNANNFFGGVAESNVRISPADTSKIYIARGSGHLLRSGNGGASFQIVNNFGNSFGFQGDYDKALALSPVDTNMMMLGLVDLIKSTNKGTTFSYVDSFSMTTSFPLHVDFHELEYSIFDSHKLYAANDGGIYVSYDDGESWTSLNNGLNVTQYYKMNSSNLNPNLILAGAQDNNTHLMDDQQWTIVLGGDGLDCSFDKGDENTAYASYQSGNVFRSSDGGKVFSKYITPPNFIGDWETPHLANPLNTNKIFIGGDKIYASYNKGDKWNIISAILDSNFLITSMAQSPNDTSVLYAASYRTIHVTHDNGLTWSNITTGLPADSASITDLKTDDNDAKIVYVTLSGFASGEKIYKTIDGGNTWTNISGTLPNVPFNTIVIQSSPLHDMYAGCDFGVFYKNDTMSDWLAFNNNLPGVIISDLDINYRSGKLFTATHGRGIYVVDLLTPVTAIANDAAITQILYPEVQEYCDSILSPLVVRIKNYGTDTLTSVTVNYTIDNGAMQNVIWSGSLAPLQFVDDTIATITLLGGTHNLVAFTSNPNNTNDDYTLNDKRSITIAVSATIAAYPFAEGFEGNVFPPADWFQSSSVLWAQDNNVGGYGNTAKSAIANFYTVISGTDNLATMRIDLTNAITNPYLSFAHAYARYSAIYSDTLAISISNDCGDNWNTVFMQHDDSLATVANFVTGPFVPAANEWRTTMIDLSAYMGQQIKVRFEARSGYGNYLYLDDINLLHSFTSLQDAHDLSDLEVFPNPATGLVYVNDANKKIKNIYIYDALGKLVYSNTNYKPHEPIDMSAFQQSMYYIKLQTSEKMETRKLNLIK